MSVTQSDYERRNGQRQDKMSLPSEFAALLPPPAIVSLPPCLRNEKFLILPASSPAPVAFSESMLSNVAPVLLSTYRTLNGPFLCCEVSFYAPLIQIPSMFRTGPILS